MAIAIFVIFLFLIGCTSPVVDFNDPMASVCDVAESDVESELLESSSSSDSSESEAEDPYCSFASASHDDRLPEVFFHFDHR